MRAKLAKNRAPPDATLDITGLGFLGFALVQPNLQPGVAALSGGGQPAMGGTRHDLSRVFGLSDQHTASSVIRHSDHPVLKYLYPK